jgi:hypothetical protein
MITNVLNDDLLEELNISWFNDISWNEYIKEIRNLVKNGVVKWTTDLTFEPNRWILRAEFLKILLKSHCYNYENEDASDLPFIDLDLETWEAKVIKKAYTMWIVSWDVDEKWNRVFRAWDFISKIEITKMLFNMARINTNIEEINLWYTDLEADWQAKYVKIWEKLNIFNAKQDEEKFVPNGSMNRSKAVGLLLKTMRLYK